MSETFFSPSVNDCSNMAMLFPIKKHCTKQADPLFYVDIYVFFRHIWYIVGFKMQVKSCEKVWKINKCVIIPHTSSLGHWSRNLSPPPPLSSYPTALTRGGQMC